MKPTFYIIALKFKLQPDGRVARDHYGNAKTTTVTIAIEADTMIEAEDLSLQIIENIGHDWLESHICSEAERMWDNGQPSFFDMEALKGTKRLKGVEGVAQ